MRPLFSVLFSSLLVVSLPAFAQHNHAASAALATGKTAPLSAGQVKKIDQAAGEIVIQHGPLDSIGMPAMTMAFGVADKRWLNQLKAGDKIGFAAEMKGGSPIVSRYELLR